MAKRESAQNLGWLGKRREVAGSPPLGHDARHAARLRFKRSQRAYAGETSRVGGLDVLVLEEPSRTAHFAGTLQGTLQAR